MNNVLVVDDEPVIVDSMHQLLDEAEHLELQVYKACNVYEALDCLNRVRIDVVLSDIRMPGITGIELHERIIRSWPRCKVIFLTGYNDFEYARHAIRNGAVDYLLKNEDDHVILAAVEKAVAQLAAEEENKDYLDRARSRLEPPRATLQKNAMFQLMLDPPASVHDLRERFAEAHVPLRSDKPVLLMVGSIDRWMDDASESDRALLLFACRNVAEEYLNPTVREVSVDFESRKLLWLVQPKDLWSEEGLEEDLEEGREEKAWSDLKTRLYGIMELLQETCGRMLKLTVSVAIGRGACGWERLGAQFHYLNALLGSGSHGEQALLIQDSDRFGSWQGAGGNVVFPASPPSERAAFEEMDRLLADGNPEAYFELFRRCLNPELAPTLSSREEIFRTVSVSLIACSIRLGVFHEVSLKMDFGRRMRADAHEEWKDAVSYLAKVAETLFDRNVPAPSGPDERLVHAVNRHIKTHLNGDLSLTMLSTVVHHSPTYLSRIYKRITGMMLSDYITEERMKHAKHLLSDTGLKIQEIAAKIGYEAAPQFNRIFKKRFKMTPQEYRDLFI